MGYRRVCKHSYGRIFIDFRIDIHIKECFSGEAALLSLRFFVAVENQAESVIEWYHVILVFLMKGV